jgi:hypothetical protein
MTTETRTTEIRQRCRTVRPDGHQCPDAALSGHEQCYPHGRDRRRLRNIRYAPAVIEIPLLDNRAAIQVVCTDVARAIAAGTIDFVAARLINASLRVAAQTLPRPTAPRAASQKEQQRAPELLAEIVVTPEGEELAPPTPYRGPEEKEEKKERVWSFSEYLYRNAYPERAAEPLPEEGYIDPGKGPIIPTTGRLEVNNPEPAKPHQPEADPSSTVNTGGINSEGRKPEVEQQQAVPGILPELEAVAVAAVSQSKVPVAQQSPRGTPENRRQEMPGRLNFQAEPNVSVVSSPNPPCTENRDAF